MALFWIIQKGLKTNPNTAVIAKKLRNKLKCLTSRYYFQQTVNVLKTMTVVREAPSLIPFIIKSFHHKIYWFSFFYFHFHCPIFASIWRKYFVGISNLFCCPLTFFLQACTNRRKLAKHVSGLWNLPKLYYLIKTDPNSIRKNCSKLILLISFYCLGWNIFLTGVFHLMNNK